MSGPQSLGVTVAGEGSPVVAVHGLFGDRRNLGLITRPLSERYQVHSLDLPNHGDSLRLEPGSIDQMAEVLSIYLESLDRPVDYIGHSLGGKVGFALVARFPYLIRSLVVLDIAPVKYALRPEQAAIMAGLAAVEYERLAQRREADERLKAFVPEASIRQFLLKSFIPIEKRVDHRCWVFQRDVLEAGLPLILAAPASGQPWSGPALVMSGEKSDYIATPEHEQAIKAWLPIVTRQVIAGAGHWLHAEQPQAVLEGIQCFLDSPPE